MTNKLDSPHLIMHNLQRVSRRSVCNIRTFFLSSSRPRLLPFLCVAFRFILFVFAFVPYPYLPFVSQFEYLEYLFIGIFSIQSLYCFFFRILISFYPRIFIYFSIYSVWLWIEIKKYIYYHHYFPSVRIILPISLSHSSFCFSPLPLPHPTPPCLTDICVMHDAFRHLSCEFLKSINRSESQMAVKVVRQVHIKRKKNVGVFISFFLLPFLFINRLLN